MSRGPMSRPGAIAVLGATGQQGGATARHLLADGWIVVAFVRDPSSLAARALADAGARLAAGDMTDETSLAAAFSGAYGVFSVQPPSWTPGPASDAEEVRLGLLAANAAARAGVRHLVYSSVLGAERQAEFGRTCHKHEIEKHVWALGLPATVLRPSGFMENVLLPASGLASGALYEPTAPEIAVPLVAVDDIGAFAAKAFGDPDRFAGQTIELAGDRLTPPEMAIALGSTIGWPVAHVAVPLEAVREQSETLAAMCGWLNAHGYPEVDIAALRALHPGLKTLDAWLRAGGVQRIVAAIEAAS